jgi:hypothetical protein
LITTVSTGDGAQVSGDSWASGGRYSRGLFGATGDFVQYSASLPAAGTYNVRVRYARGPDLGRWRFTTAGIALGPEQNAHADAFSFTEVNLGDVAYATSGRKLLRFTVSGKHTQNTGYGTAVDYVMFSRR